MYWQMRKKFHQTEPRRQSAFEIEFSLDGTGGIGAGGVFASCLFVRQFGSTKVFMFDGIQERFERSKVFACYFWAETSHV